MVSRGVRRELRIRIPNQVVKTPSELVMLVPDRLARTDWCSRFIFFKCHCDPTSHVNRICKWFNEQKRKTSKIGSAMRASPSLSQVRISLVAIYFKRPHKPGYEYWAVGRIS
ncbi:hypothetical protein VNO77_44092 [Canavalia gladiata]|uniref:Uncharacterized protein n=1 Tax=Canavalia gladiata TaxID=3824 RepID=A0AAN9PQ22_CANGL